MYVLIHCLIVYYYCILLLLLCMYLLHTRILRARRRSLIHALLPSHAYAQLPFVFHYRAHFVILHTHRYLLYLRCCCWLVLYFPVPLRLLLPRRTRVRLHATTALLYTPPACVLFVRYVAFWTFCVRAVVDFVAFVRTFYTHAFLRSFHALRSARPAPRPAPSPHTHNPAPFPPFTTR